MVVRELIVDLDDEARRLAWSAQSERLVHHNAFVQVFEDGPGAQIVWVCDLLPDEMRELVEGMMDNGMAAMKRTLDGSQQG
jgi:hypothetical protein